MEDREGHAQGVEKNFNLPLSAVYCVQGVLRMKVTADFTRDDDICLSLPKTLSVDLHDANLPGVDEVFERDRGVVWTAWSSYDSGLTAPLHTGG